MRSKAMSVMAVMVLSLSLFPASAYADNANPALALAKHMEIEAQSTASGRPMDLHPKYSAFLTNGKKGSAYKAYTSYPFDVAVIHKARIVGNKLRLSGTYQTTGGTLAKPAKRYKVKDKAFKLTSKTRYYQHTGNNNFYMKSSKSKMKKLLASKPANFGGDISFTVKNGKVTLLIAQ